MPVTEAGVAIAVPRVRRGPLARLRRFLGTPKGTMLWVLAALVTVASLGPDGPGLERLAITLGAAVVIEFGIIGFNGGRLAFPSGALISGLLVAMVLAPLTPPWVAPLVAATAMACKHLIRTRWSNVFNPAALALILGAVLLHGNQNWWGALPGDGLWGFALVVAAGWFLAARVNKLPLALTFLGTCLATFTVASFLGAAAHVAQVFRSPDINALVFFASLMLTDPPTSPARHRDQVWFGAVVAVASCAIFLTLGVQWFILGGLPLGNACESARRLLSRPRRIAGLRAQSATLPGTTASHRETAGRA